MSSKSLEKIKLIYEFNNNSPLFARVAEDYIYNGDYEKAISILERGLENLPNYTSAKIVLLEALSKKGEYKKVIDLIDELRGRVDAETANYYLDKFEDEREKRKELQTSSKKNERKIEDDLENLADTISRAKIPRADNSNEFDSQDSHNPKGDQFISETLAEIYVTQSNFNEAIKIYERLIETNPDKEEHFKAKIEKIKNSQK